MKKIAVLKLYQSSYYARQNDDDPVALSCTDFTEVSDEDFELIKQAFAAKNANNTLYRVVEQVSDETVLKTVEDFKQAALKKKKEEDELKEKKKKEALIRAQKAAILAEKKAQAARDAKFKMLAQLKAELGE